MKTRKSILLGVIFSGLACLTGMVSCNTQPTEEQAQAALEKKGGMVVTLDTDVPSLIDALSDHSQDPIYLEAMQAAEQIQSDEDFISRFIFCYQTLNPDASLYPVFSYSLRDRLCGGMSNQEVEAALREEVQKAITNSHYVLQARLDRFGAKKAFVKVDDENRIIAIIPEVQEPERVRRLLQSDGRLGFWATYEMSELLPRLAQINREFAAAQQDEVEEVAEAVNDAALRAEYIKHNPLFGILNPCVYANGEAMSGPAVGSVHFADTARVRAMLTSEAAKRILPADVRFVWTAKPEREGMPYYNLIALKAMRNGRVALEGDIIIGAKATHNKWSPEPVIDLEMNQEGARCWQHLTRDNIGKSIAIVVNGLVYSYPRVMCEIECGKSQITGSFTEEEAADMANLLNSGVMPCPVRIVEEQIIESQK